MAITVTAATPASNNGAVTSGSITTTGGAGSLLLVFVQSRSPGNTPTDSKSNTYTALSAEQALSISGTTYYCRVWKCKAGTGGTLHTASSTNSGSPFGYQTIHFMELLGSSGLDIDQAISWNVDSTTTYNSGSVTAALAGLAISFNSILSFSAGSSITHSGDGFTSTASSYMNGSVGPCSEVVYQTSSASTAYQDAVSATSPSSNVAFGIFTVGVASTQTYSYSASGGMVFSGTSAQARARAVAAAGGLVTGGTAAQLRKRAIAGAGGAVFGGAADVGTFINGGTSNVIPAIRRMLGLSLGR